MLRARDRVPPELPLLPTDTILDDKNSVGDGVCAEEVGETD
jgi:hypothetical protein